jgi:CRP-like cAMP-binding protein/Fe-S-cluster-containing hydrogenase component 2
MAEEKKEHGEGQGKPNIPVLPGFELVEIPRLKQYPFLSRLSDTVLRKLQPSLLEKRYAAGETILRMGDYSDAAFYLAEGLVQVRIAPVAPPGRRSEPPAALPARDGESFWFRLQRIFGRKGVDQAIRKGGLAADGTVILSDMPVDMRPDERILLEAGEIFGEMSALSRYPVSADVIAETDVLCLLIRTPALRVMFKQKDLADFKRFIDDRYRSRSLANHLRRVDLFSGLDDRVITELQRTAELTSFEPGAMIVAQDSPGDAFYMVRGGYVKVGVRAGSGDLAVTYLRKGDHAGEIALLLDEPWPFSLYALEHVEMVKISREEFQRVLSAYPQIQEMLWQAGITRLKERGNASRNPLASQYLQMAMDTGLIHGESVLLIDLNTCTRCDDCVRACADTHGGTPRFIREGAKYQHWTIPVSCYQCTDPVCMIGCPTGAITRPVGTLEVTVNRDTCIGCANCVKRCPWGNIVEVPFDSPTLGRKIDLATKCDLCLGRSQGPACVQMCPHGSAVRISFKDFQTVTDTLSR